MRYCGVYNVLHVTGDIKIVDRSSISLRIFFTLRFFFFWSEMGEIGFVLCSFCEKSVDIFCVGSRFQGRGGLMIECFKDFFGGFFMGGFWGKGTPSA